MLGDGMNRALAETPGTGIETCYIGPEAATRLAEFGHSACGVTCLAVSDENTWQAGGNRVVEALTAAGVEVIEKVYGPDPLDATDVLGDEVVASGAECDFFVAMGAGTLCDLAKYAGTKLDRPALLYPTAASMNGYTSGIVAMKVRGLKRTDPCRPATGIFADPEVVATAPQRMLAAGVADFLSKCSAGADWRTAHFLRDEYYDEGALRFYEGVLDPVLDSVDAIGKAEPEAVGLALEALLLSGLSMLVAGSSAPASGGEHLLSHYLDMKHGLYGAANDLHGTQVGIGTVHCLELWEKILAVDPAALDIDALANAQPSPETVARGIEEDWGAAVAPEVLKQWQAKALTPEGLKAELERFRDGFDTLRAAVQKDLLPSATVAGAIRRSGGPVTIEDTEASVEEYRNAVQRARFIRSRFTVLDLAAELGLA